MIKEANVTLIVGDMERSIQFYAGTLGLKVKANYGNEFALIQGPGLTAALHPPTPNGAKPGDSRSVSIGFGVDDLDSTVSDLKSKGVQFSRVVDDTQVRLAFFADPDGNPLYLSHSKWG